MGLECQYRGPARVPLPVAKDEQLSRIEAQLKTMEDLLKRNEALLQNNVLPGCQRSPMHCLAVPEDISSERSANTDGQTATNHSESFDTSTNDALGRQDPINGVDGLALITFRDEEAMSHFGRMLVLTRQLDVG